MIRWFPRSVFGLSLLTLAAPALAEQPPPDVVPASAPAPAKPPDYAFPGHKRVSVSLATGIPFVVMSELAVGLGNRFALGALAGIALSGSDGPRNTGFGLRPRVVLLEFGSTRVTTVAPLLFYPIARGSWLLARPSIYVEHRFPNGAFLGGGMGAVLVSTVDNLSGRKSVVLPYGGGSTSNAADGSNGIWNTASLVGALALGSQTQVFAEATLVLRGVQLAGDNWIGAVPFTATLGLSTTL